MPIKPLAGVCRIREQIVEDLPSGLDTQGGAVQARAAKHAFRRPSWLH